MWQLFFLKKQKQKTNVCTVIVQYVYTFSVAVTVFVNVVCNALQMFYTKFQNSVQYGELTTLRKIVRHLYKLSVYLKNTVMKSSNSVYSNALFALAT